MLLERATSKNCVLYFQYDSSIIAAQRKDSIFFTGPQPSPDVALVVEQHNSRRDKESNEQRR